MERWRGEEWRGEEWRDGGEVEMWRAGEVERWKVERWRGGEKESVER